MSRAGGLSRRQVCSGAVLASAHMLAAAGPAWPRGPAIRFGLTPVFLNDDLELLARLQAFLERATARPVELVQRRTYEEITSLLISGQLTAAWICGYPYIQYRQRLEIVAVPVWRGRPLYQSYLIVANDRDATALDELRGDVHAFSDPNSNSGYLVTCAQLLSQGRRPETFFRRSFFTYGHRNVVRAVAAGLADSGSVDGYVWEVLTEIEPDLVQQTRVVARSEWLGFPPIATLRLLSGSPEVALVRDALDRIDQDEDGRAVLQRLRLDGFAPSQDGLFEGIAARVEVLRRFG